MGTYGRLAGLLIAAMLLAACDSDPSGPAEGERLLPDLVPLPAAEIHVSHPEGDASVALMRFTSVLVNVGEGDFVLQGVRDESADGWAVSQQVTVFGRDPEISSVDASIVWGGDGHDHWHVTRAATYRLVPLGEDGQELGGVTAGVDTKVGFCFFDTRHEVERLGPDEAVFERDDCGDEQVAAFQVGLSPGWADEYLWTLPGQMIDITALEDGHYRLWAEADDQGRFLEATRDNNVTWVDLDIKTVQDGFRLAQIVEIGPQPE